MVSMKVYPNETILVKHALLEVQKQNILKCAKKKEAEDMDQKQHVQSH